MQKRFLGTHTDDLKAFDCIHDAEIIPRNNIGNDETIMDVQGRNARCDVNDGIGVSDRNPENPG